MVTDMAGAGDGAPSGVGGLGSGQVRPGSDANAATAGLSAARAGGVSRKAAANRLKRQCKAAEQCASQPTP